MQAKAQGALDHFGFNAISSPQAAGTSFTITVTAQDSSDATITDYTGMVNFTSTDSQAVLPSNYTFVPGDDGTHSFSVTLVTASSQSITVTDSAAGISSTTDPIMVDAASASYFVVSGFPSSTTAGVSGSVTVTAYDAYGDVATGYAGLVHFTSSDGQAVLPADSTLSSGTGTFTVTLVTAGSQSITATDTSDSSITDSQSGITVGLASPTLTSTAPSGAVVGTGFTDSSVLAGTSGSNAGGTVTYTLYSGTSPVGTMVGTPDTETVSSGVVPDSTSFTVNTAGPYYFTAVYSGDSNNNGASSSAETFTVNVGSLSKFVVVAPSSATAGSAFTLSVTAEDAYGNTISSYSSSVGLSASSGTISPTSTGTSGWSNGVWSYSSVTLTTSGSITIIANDHDGHTGAASLTVVANVAIHLVVTSSGGTQTAGVPFTILVRAVDAYENTATSYLGTVVFTTSDPGAGVSLPSPYTFTAGNAGEASFSAILVTAGSQSITATDTSDSSIYGSQTGITVGPASASTFSISTISSPQTAGVGFNITITALDAYGNTATSYADMPSLSDLSGTISPTSTSAFVGGVWTGSVAVKLAVSDSITATDGAINGASNLFTVTHAAALSVTVLPGTATITAGDSQAFTVTAADFYGNTWDVTGLVTWSIASGAGGSWSSNIYTSHTAGSWTVAATYSGLQGTASLTVNAGALATVGVSGPASVTAGGTATFTATGFDAEGNSLGVETASWSITSGAAGSWSYNVYTSHTAGSWTVSALVSTVTGTASLTVNAAAAASFVVSGFPSPTVAGVAHSVMVTAKDVYGNMATGYSGTVAITSSDGKAVLPVSAGLIDGVGSFTVTLETAGSQSINATDTVTNSITGYLAVTVVANVAIHLVVTSSGGTVTAGVPFTVLVRAVDAYGNTATSYLGTVVFTTSDLGFGVSLPGDYTFTAENAGEVSFSAVLVTAGSQSINATDTVTNSITGYLAVTVNPNSGTRLVVTSSGGTQTAGVPFTILVRAVNAYGNTATSYVGTVVFTTSDLGFGVSLPGSYTFTAENAGEVSFSAVLVTAGSQSIRATDASNSSIAGSLDVTVNAAGLDHIVISPASPSIVAGNSQVFTAEAFDQYGNSLGDVTSSATFTAPGASVTGNSVYATVVGSYTVTATYSGKSDSTTLMVNANALDHFVFNTVATQTAGSAFTIKVTAKDAYGNTVSSYTGTTSLTYSAGSISPSTMNAFVSGVGSTSVTVTAAGSGVTITATDGSHTGISNLFTVTAAPTPTPTATPSPSPTATPIPASTPTPTPAATPTPIVTLSPTPTLSATTSPGPSLELVLIVVATAVEIIIILTVIAIIRLRRKSSNASS